MRKLFIAITNNHETLVKYILAFLTVAIIVLLLPKESQFNFSYRKAKPWPYDNLIAPFDFAINKTEAEINEERALVLKRVKPFYRFSNDVVNTKVNSFKNEFIEVWRKQVVPSNPKDADKYFAKKDRQLISGEKLLRQVYDKGIILINEQSIAGNPDRTITVIRSNIAEDKSIPEFFTIQSAYNYIEQKLREENSEDVSQLLPLLENALTHNVNFDDATTRQDTRQQLENIMTTRGMVREGELIILKGEMVDEDKAKKLESLRDELEHQEYTGNSKWMLMLGHFILVGLAISMLMIFLFLFRKDIYADNKRILFLLMMVVFMCGLFLWARKISLIDMYLVPVCILPIIVRAFYDTRTALFTHIITLMIISFEAPAGFEFMFIQTIAGMTAIFTIVSMSKRSQFFISVLFIFLSYSISFVGVTVIHEANFRTIDWMNLKWFLGNTVITLFAFPLIYIFEKAFGFLSDVSLLELSDSNSSLLRELAFKAPGTFQHAMQVANLAEAAVQRIGGNPLLVRAGALYHDIGKVDMPMYFIENQSTQVNPHDELSFEESARIIKSHVIRGIEKSRQGKLPEQIIDFVRTHHGNMRLQYFYQSFVKTFPDEIPDEEDFRYPGPLPFSKETAVLMMADSVEASSRSLQHPTSENIDKLVEEIINKQIADNQFINSPVTLKNISDIKRIFKKMLNSIYHVRIEYPS